MLSVNTMYLGHVHCWTTTSSLSPLPTSSSPFPLPPLQLWLTEGNLCWPNKCTWEQVTIQCLVLNGLSPAPEGQETSRKRGWKDCKNQRWSCHVFWTQGLLYSRTHISLGCPHKTHPDSIPAWRGWELKRFHQNYQGNTIAVFFVTSLYLKFFRPFVLLLTEEANHWTAAHSPGEPSHGIAL